MKTAKLFKLCAYDIKYETAGNDVNYEQRIYRL